MLLRVFVCYSWFGLVVYFFIWRRFVSVSCSGLYCFVLILCYFIFFRFDLVRVGSFSGLCGLFINFCVWLQGGFRFFVRSFACLLNMLYESPRR